MLVVTHSTITDTCRISLAIYACTHCDTIIMTINLNDFQTLLSFCPRVVCTCCVRCMLIRVAQWSYRLTAQMHWRHITWMLNRNWLTATRSAHYAKILYVFVVCVLKIKKYWNLKVSILPHCLSRKWKMQNSNMFPHYLPLYSIIKLWQNKMYTNNISRRIVAAHLFTYFLQLCLVIYCLYIWNFLI